MRLSCLLTAVLLGMPLQSCWAQRRQQQRRRAGKKGESKECDASDSKNATIQYPYDAWLPAEDAQDTAQRLAIPSLSTPFYNTVVDVRATVSAKNVEFILSTAGNWQFALTKLLNEKFFPANPSVQNSYLITTSPPISVPQLRNGRVKVGNILYTDAQPHLAVGPAPLMNGLTNMNLVQGSRIPLLSNYGNVILKLKSNKKVQSFADLFDLEPGRFASSGPAEGSTNNYRNSIQNMILQNPELVGAKPEDAPEMAADLLAHLFDNEEGGVATIGPPMHQSVPHVLMTGQADAGLMFLELAVGIMTNNPGVFEAIYLAKDKKMGMSTDDPMVLAQGQEPLAGNVVLTMFITRTNVALSAEQEAAREAFLAELESAEFTDILWKSGLRPPVM